MPWCRRRYFDQLSAWPVWRMRVSGVEQAARNLRIYPRPGPISDIDSFQPQAVVIRWRVRTALISSVMRGVLHRSFSRRCQDFGVATACSPSARIFAWERLWACCPADKPFPPPPVGHADGTAGSATSLVGPARRFTLASASMMRWVRTARMSWTAPRQRG